MIITSKKKRREDQTPHSPNHLDCALEVEVVGTLTADKAELAKTLQWWTNQLLWNTGEIHNPERFSLN